MGDLGEINLVETMAPGIAAGLFSCVFAIIQNQRMMAKPVGKDIGKPLLDTLAGQIKSGSIAFLKTEYTFLGVFVAFLAAVLFGLFSVQNDVMDGVRVVIAFILGAGLSALAGYLGMSVATSGNVRTTVACTEGSLNDGLTVAFTTGTVMGFMVVGLGLMGMEICFFALLFMTEGDLDPALRNLSAFGFGASSIALFARVAGGIYTKAADVGADLVGKVEAGIDEDDPHNPAVIADNVGDNVGDVAGMGADLFESYVGSIIAAATLAKRDNEIAFPFWLSACGVVAAMIGTMAVSTNEKGEGWNSNLGALMWALEKGTMLAGAIFLGLGAACCHLLGGMWGAYICVLIGLACGMVIGKITEYFTSFDFAPVKSIKARGATGPATVTTQGLGVGMISCVPTIVVLVCAILGCAAIKGEYGVAIAAVGMLASLDALGNTTAATGKGFAIGSAVLTSLSLLAAFKEQARLAPWELAVTDPYVLSGMLFG